jgi:hypothetical protein
MISGDADLRGCIVEAARVTTPRKADRMRMAQISLADEEEEETIKRRVKLKKGISSELPLTFTFGAYATKQRTNSKQPLLLLHEPRGDHFQPEIRAVPDVPRDTSPEPRTEF